MQKTNRKIKKKNIAQEVNAKLQESDEKKNKLDSIAIIDMFYTKTCKPVLKKKQNPTKKLFSVSFTVKVWNSNILTSF